MTPLRDYLNRSGDEALGLGWMEENEHGFCVWRVKDGTLILVNVYGDGRYWDQWADEKCAEQKLTKIQFGTRRNPATFERKYGYKVTAYLMERTPRWVE